MQWLCGLRELLEGRREYAQPSRGFSIHSGEPNGQHERNGSQTGGVQLQSQCLGSGGGGQPLLQFELEASLGYKRPFLTNNNKNQMKEMEVKT